jgi:predicted PhzF superfamily epimerase YddE/YHI9
MWARCRCALAGEGSLFGEMTQRDPEFGAELDAEEVARLIGLARGGSGPALPPQIVSTGRRLRLSRCVA